VQAYTAESDLVKVMNSLRDRKNNFKAAM